MLQTSKQGGSSENKYWYVSFSELNNDYNLNTLIQNAANWTTMDSEVLQNFDYKRFRTELTLADPPPSNLANLCNDMSVAEQVLELLLHDRYRSGSRNYVTDYKANFISKIEQAIADGRPVDLVIPSFPGREVNPIARTRPQLHLGEIAAMCRFAEMAEISKRIYEPGIRFIIVSDGVCYAPFYGDPVAGALQYRETLKQTIEKLGVSQYIILEDLQDIIDERKEEFQQIYAEVKNEIKEVWSDPEYLFRDKLSVTMRMGTQSSALNAAVVHLIKFMEESESDLEILREMRAAIKKSSERTAFIYQCLLITMRRMELLDRRFPDAIRSTVHPKDSQYSPYLLNEYTTVSPWHGVPIMRPNGRIDVVYEAVVLSEPNRYSAVYLPGEVTPFFYKEKLV
ncbi:L-tyrosine/L-tryptophan isonitrile synthase family protein [Bacillus thuringiensis]|nr:L-tyrosine/L-tryptophan isonitrile synthase family protein [Bacillus thuringiensis]